MISRALARDIDGFKSLVDSHLARMLEVMGNKLRHLGNAEQTQLIQDSLVIAFRKRDELDPQFISVSNWFGQCVQVAQFETVELDADELLMLAALSPAAPHSTQPQQAQSGMATVPREATDAELKPGKECPPCWRCRYFDGWLPRGEPKIPFCADPGVYEAIRNLDRRKVEIANYVRGEYPEELLED